MHGSVLQSVTVLCPLWCNHCTLGEDRVSRERVMGLTKRGGQVAMSFAGSISSPLGIDFHAGLVLAP